VPPRVCAGKGTESSGVAAYTLPELFRPLVETAIMRGWLPLGAVVPGGGMAQATCARLSPRVAGRLKRLFSQPLARMAWPGVEPAPVARLPVAPGDSDLCFAWPGTVEEAKAHLERCGVAVELEPDCPRPYRPSVLQAIVCNVVDDPASSGPILIQKHAFVTPPN
jgi:hypothetical protein